MTIEQGEPMRFRVKGDPIQLALDCTGKINATPFQNRDAGGWLCVGVFWDYLQAWPLILFRPARTISLSFDDGSEFYLYETFEFNALDLMDAESTD